MKGLEACASEASYLSTMRIGMQGSRQVCVVDIMQFVTFLSKTLSQDTLKPKLIYHELKSMNHDTLKSFNAECAGAMYCATLGPLDCIWLPSGWFFYEKVNPSRDCIGFKIAVLCNSAESVLDDICQHLKSTGSNTEALQAVIDCLALSA